MTLSETLKRLRELHEKATPGPWFPRATDDAHYQNARFVSTKQGPLRDGKWAHDNVSRVKSFQDSVCVTLYQMEPEIGIEDDLEDANMELIAEVRTALGALLDAADRGQKLNRRLEVMAAEIAAWRAAYPDIRGSQGQAGHQAIARCMDDTDAMEP